MISIMQNNGRKKVSGWVSQAAVLAVWLAIWQILYMCIGQDLILPGPADVCISLLNKVGTVSFYHTALISILRILGGFFLAMVVGTALGILTYYSKLCNAFFHPALSVIKATPVASFIILALIWIQTDFVPVFIAFLMVVPLFWANVKEGLGQVDRNLLEMAGMYGFSRKQRITSIYLPSMMPYFMTAMTTGLGLGWKAGVAAEVLCTPRISIGIQLYNAKVYLETVDLFCWTAMVILLSVLIEKGLVLLIQRVGAKYYAQ